MENSFYQNVFLLTQVVPPSNDFLKYFKEGMFDRPNTIGFLHASQYLLSIYDADRFKKQLQWPLFCKKDEAKYRTDVRDFIIAVSNENPDIDFPQILASHLLHASGSKFSTIMWSLSTVTLRAYLRRQIGVNLLAPKSGVAEDMSKVLLHNLINQSAKNIEEISSCMSAGERDAKMFAEETANAIQKHQDDLLLTRHSLMDIAPRAPVHPAMRKRLADPNDIEVVEIWKKSIKESLSYLKSRQKRLKEIMELSNSVARMVASIASADSNMLDGNRLPRLDTKTLSETDGLSPEAQITLHRLYVNDVLSLENLLVVLNLFLSNFRRQVERNGFLDLSGCDSQIRASCEDMTSLTHLFRAMHERINSIANDIKNDQNQENNKNTQKDIQLHHMDSDIFDSVLLKSSPTININGNHEPERTDVHERLELTPVENMHKALFSRYKRKDDTTPKMSKLRPKLLVSRINFDDSRSSCTSERVLSPVNRMTSSKLMNKSIASRNGKYSHLFTSYQKKNNSRFNSSFSSVPGWWRNSTVTDATATSDLYNMSGLRPHLTSTEKKLNKNQMSTPTKVTPTRNNEGRACSTINDEASSLAPITISQTVIDEGTELRIEVGRSPKVRQAEKNSDRNRRASISDLVERYKRVRERAIDVTARLENSSDVSDESGRH